MKKFLLMLLLAGVCIPLGVRAQAPKKVSIEGTVTEYNTKEPIAGCVVSIPTLELWVVTIVAICRRMRSDCKFG